MRHKHTKKILMLIPELGYGGAEKSFIRLSQLLSEYYDVTIVVFTKHYAKGNYAEENIEINIPLEILDNQENLTRIKRWKKRWGTFKKLKDKHDLCISFLTGANILNASVKSKCKTVVSMRGSRQYDPNIARFKRYIYQLVIDPITFSLSDKVVSVSEGLTYELGKFVPKSVKKKIETIEIFVNARELIALAKAPIEKEIEVLSKYPIIISAGRLSPEKGYQFLIPIFSEVRKKNPRAKLVLIGDGPKYEELQALCNKYKLNNTNKSQEYETSAVIFLGYRENPLRYFRIAKVFVLSSLTEGFSNSLVESLASGILPIAVDSPWGPRSILSNQKKSDRMIPYPQVLPNEVEYGVLMPRIDKEQFQTLWSSYLINVLEKNTINKESKREERVKDLDLDIIGAKWLTLINNLLKEQ